MPTPAASPSKPKLAVYKLTSCDGCQLSLLELEDELLELTDAVELAFFKEATSTELPGPYDVALVEGSISTPKHLDEIRHIRASAKTLVAIGACATAGGIQALRNFANVRAFTELVYASPEHIQTLERSTAISAHVKVDLELRGCPVDKRQLLDALLALLHGRRPNVRSNAVCVDCKLAQNPCLLVLGQPCLGPVVHAGCGALCPTYGRGCYGCFGPSEAADPARAGAESSERFVSLEAVLRKRGLGPRELSAAYRTFNAGAPAFEAESRRLEGLASSPSRAPADGPARVEPVGERGEP